MEKILQVSPRMNHLRFSRVWTTCYSRGLLRDIEVQVLVRPGLSRFDIIGLPQNMIREGKDRILASLHRLGIELPSEKILVHLNPGDIPKEGSHFDLPILAGILQALGLTKKTSEKIFYWGELQLDGSIRPTPDILAHLLFSQNLNAARLFAGPLSPELEGLQKYLKRPLKSLKHSEDLLLHTTEETIASLSPAGMEVVEKAWLQHLPKNSIWDQRKGSQEQFLFWCLVSLGRLHVLCEGSPGVGKSSWCRAVAELQRPLKPSYWSEKFHFQGVASHCLQTFEDLIESPFEAPHHTSSAAAIVGGGSGKIVPGAITRAHRGILFLDELPEFDRDVLEALREPLEEKFLKIARRGEAVEYPADVQILAAMNPCACGNQSSSRLCVCNSNQFWKYKTKISEPLRDRFHFSIWWQYRNAPALKAYSLKEVRHRLCEIEKQPLPVVSALDLSFLENPRKQKLWLEAFVTWGRWFNISTLTAKDLKDFSTFLNHFEEQDHVPNIRSRV